jgi:hypothetical protein
MRNTNPVSAGTGTRYWHIPSPGGTDRNRASRKGRRWGQDFPGGFPPREKIDAREELIVAEYAFRMTIA